MSLQQANQQFVTNRGRSIAELSSQRPVLLLFLRHSGCTFCEEALADLSVQQAAVEANGIQIVLVHMGVMSKMSELLIRYDLKGVEHISDFDCRLYRAYELQRGRFAQMFGMAVWFRGIVAGIVNRHGVGYLDGDGFQMPGMFLIKDSKIVKTYQYESVADRPDYCEFSSAM